MQRPAVSQVMTITKLLQSLINLSDSIVSFSVERLIAGFLFWITSHCNGVLNNLSLFCQIIVFIFRIIVFSLYKCFYLILNNFPIVLSFPSLIVTLLLTQTFKTLIKAFVYCIVSLIFPLTPAHLTHCHSLFVFNIFF